MAGTVDLVQRCFAGVELRDDVLWSIADHTVRVSSGPGSFPPGRVGCRGQLRDLMPGQILEFKL